MPIFQQAVYQDPGVYIVDQAKFMAAIYMMCEVMFQFYTQPGTIVYFARDYGKYMADTMDGKKNWVYKE